MCILKRMTLIHPLTETMCKLSPAASDNRHTALPKEKTCSSKRPFKLPASHLLQILTLPRTGPSPRLQSASHCNPSFRLYPSVRPSTTNIISSYIPYAQHRQSCRSPRSVNPHTSLLHHHQHLPKRLHRSSRIVPTCFQALSRR